MASRLTSTADFTKKGAVFLGIGIILFITLRYSFKFAYNLCCVRPTPTPTPYINLTYGVLAPNELPVGVSKSAGIKFNLETISGTVPEGTSSATVYEILKKNPELDYQTTSESLANKLGFPGVKPTKNTDRTFLFQDPVDPNKKLEIDFAYYNLNFTYDNPAAYVSLVRGATPTIQKAKQNGVSYLYQARPELKNLKNSLDVEGDAKGSYVYLDPTLQQSAPVSSQLQANVTKANISRLPIKGVPIISPYTTKSLINFTYTGITSSTNTQNFQDRLIDAEIVYWPINPTPSILAVYPLRTAQKAYDKLLAGGATVLNPLSGGEEINIRSIYLAYYEPPVYQPYMQPVWVFEGDKPNDSNFLFRAIVPAIQEGLVQE